MTSATTLFAASAPFRTVHHGRFRILVTDDRITEGRHLVLVKGQVTDESGVLCRVASACITSTALDADDCDCAGQNHSALEAIDTAGQGVLIHLDQEGRGNGLVAKVQALNGKEAGLDTFAAIEQLGFPADNRNYGDAALILEALKIRSIRLLTNNPDKAAALAHFGLVIDDQLPCLDAHPPLRSLRHLAAKARRGHRIPGAGGPPRADGQFGAEDQSGTGAHRRGGDSG